MKKIFIFYLMFICLFIFKITIVTAASPCICADGTNKGELSIEECQRSCGNTSAGTVSLTNPIPTSNIPTLLGKIISSVLGIVGSLALVMFIYGGITWMTSAGNQEQVTKGKNILIWATIGIVIIFTAYALVRFVLTTVTGT